MHLRENTSLKEYSSFGCGGLAEHLVGVESADEMINFISSNIITPIWLLGYGTNCLISDEGLPGVTIISTAGSCKVVVEDNTNLLLADATTWWDDAVALAIENGLWGIELMSAIPGSVGAAVAGNIAAYGQSVSDSLQYIEVLDIFSHQVHKLDAGELNLDYRSSVFQTPAFANKIILRAAFALQAQMTKPLSYQSANDVANELGLDSNNLMQRRQIIIKTRERAGSLQDREHSGQFAKSAGSFFKNPVVDSATAKLVATYDESGRTHAQLAAMSKEHGGDSLRIPAALLLLASGYKRGQAWGQVRLHPNHIQKIENIGQATAQAIYDVAQEIIATVQQKTGITLEPEVRFIGHFK